MPESQSNAFWPDTSRAYKPAVTGGFGGLKALKKEINT